MIAAIVQTSIVKKSAAASVGRWEFVLVRCARIHVMASAWACAVLSGDVVVEIVLLGKSVLRTNVSQKKRDVTRSVPELTVEQLRDAIAGPVPPSGIAKR